MRLLTIGVLLLALATGTLAQQVADTEFDTSVENPAYSRNGPRVMFDEAHHNFHTADGRYKPFVDLLMGDGYQVIRNRKPFTKASLSGFKVLVIANALGAEDMDDEGSDQSAFTEDEITAVHDWVKGGGALLLIADHAPFGGASAALATKLGVDMSKGYTFDAANALQGIASFLVFSRENKLLGPHPIFEGRNEKERVNRVLSFTGQSLKGPEDSSLILKLADTAQDSPNHEQKNMVAATGRAQALAFKVGKGRVVVHGEAAMLSAQISGQEKFKMGMNFAGYDNKQYALNLMHWLSGLLREK
ncbi:MAG TPA: hypothetical protein VFD62_00275 [Pyrinomonadaceae bacterium]|nr:hypothetical protein [Pyrinomonadaceae bacterium]